MAPFFLLGRNINWRYPSGMKFCWANTIMMLVIIALGTLSMLSACGQKGDLYLPEKEQPAEKK